MWLGCGGRVHAEEGPGAWRVRGQDQGHKQGLLTPDRVELTGERPALDLLMAA